MRTTLDLDDDVLNSAKKIALHEEEDYRAGDIRFGTERLDSGSGGHGAWRRSDSIRLRAVCLAGYRRHKRANRQVARQNGCVIPRRPVDPFGKNGTGHGFPIVSWAASTDARSPPDQP